MSALPLDKALALAGLVACLAGGVWLWGCLFVELGWDNVRRLLRDPPFLLAILDLLLVVVSYLA
jgi:hypothetical protein